jgi:prevent-host-death family protein
MTYVVRDGILDVGANAAPEGGGTSVINHSLDVDEFVTVSKARQSLSDIIDGLRERRTIITRNGLPTAVLMSFQEYRALKAIQALAADPDRLRQALQERAAGARRPIDDLLTPQEAVAKTSAAG